MGLYEWVDMIEELEALFGREVRRSTSRVGPRVWGGPANLMWAVATVHVPELIGALECLIPPSPEPEG